MRNCVTAFFSIGKYTQLPENIQEMFISKATDF